MFFGRLLPLLLIPFFFLSMIIPIVVLSLGEGEPQLFTSSLPRMTFQLVPSLLSPIYIRFTLTSFIKENDLFHIFTTSYLSPKCIVSLQHMFLLEEIRKKSRLNSKMLFNRNFCYPKRTHKYQHGVAHFFKKYHLPFILLCSLAGNPFMK